MTKKRLIFFVVLFLLGIAIAVLIMRLNPGKEKWIDIIMGSAVPILIGVCSYAIQPFSKWLDEKLNSNFAQRFCNIYFYATAGTGKTSLINSWSTGEDSSPLSTNNTEIVSLNVLLNNSKNQSIQVSVLDYKGQKPSQVTTKITKEIKDVNAAIFLVDIVGRYDDSDNMLDTFNRQIDYLRIDSNEKICKRVNEHKTYINGGLEIVFSTIYNSNLSSVKLLINKFDIIQYLFDCKLISNPHDLTAEEYAKKIFTEIESEIGKACRANQIANFSVELISAKNDFNTRKVLRQIINLHIKSIDYK